MMNRGKVFVVEEAELMNPQAQNALLKTLEEPPGHAIIFMVAESERALLDTVRSRMRLVRFAPLDTADIEAILAARGEAADRAAALARLARGSAGRALSLITESEPPVHALLKAIAEAHRLDFPRAQSLAQEFFGAREQASENFELIARMLEEILCLKLLRTPSSTTAAETGEMMKKMSDSFALHPLLAIMKGAVEAAAAIDEMANPRLQAERWWMTVGEALRSR
jgi:DNA polymerase-3 subunit delta'